MEQNPILEPVFTEQETIRRDKLKKYREQGQDPFTITRYDGYEPEASKDSGPAAANYGVDFGYQPSLRSFLVGASIKF